MHVTERKLDVAERVPELNCITPPHQPLLQTKAKSLAPRLLGDSRCTLNSGVMWIWGSNGETGCGEGGTFKWGRNVKESGNSGASSSAPGVRVLPRLPIPFMLDF
jgi:hypothetical protein